MFCSEGVMVMLVILVWVFCFLWGWALSALSKLLQPGPQKLGGHLHRPAHWRGPLQHTWVWRWNTDTHSRPLDQPKPSLEQLVSSFKMMGSWCPEFLVKDLNTPSLCMCVAGGWGAWSEWTECEERLQHRSRTCKISPVPCEGNGTGWRVCAPSESAGNLTCSRLPQSCLLNLCHPLPYHGSVLCVPVGFPGQKEGLNCAGNAHHLQYPLKAI